MQPPLPPLGQRQWQQLEVETAAGGRGARKELVLWTLRGWLRAAARGEQRHMRQQPSPEWAAKRLSPRLGWGQVCRWGRGVRWALTAGCRGRGPWRERVPRRVRQGAVRKSWTWKCHLAGEGASQIAGAPVPLELQQLLPGRQRPLEGRLLRVSLEPGLGEALSKRNLLLGRAAGLESVPNQRMGGVGPRSEGRKRARRRLAGGRRHRQLASKSREAWQAGQGALCPARA